MVDLIVSAFTIMVSIILTCVMFQSKITHTLIIIIPVTFSHLLGLFNRFNKNTLRGVMEKSADLESQLVESLNNISTIRYLNLKRMLSKNRIGFCSTTYDQLYFWYSYQYLQIWIHFFFRSCNHYLLWSGSALVFKQKSDSRRSDALIFPFWIPAGPPVKSVSESLLFRMRWLLQTGYFRFLIWNMKMIIINVWSSYRQNLRVTFISNMWLLDYGKKRIL